MDMFLKQCQFDENIIKKYSPEFIKFPKKKYFFDDKEFILINQSKQDENEFKFSFTY